MESVKKMCKIQKNMKELQNELKRLREEKEELSEMVMEYMEEKKIDSIPVSEMEVMIMMKEVEKKCSINGKYIQEVLEKYYDSKGKLESVNSKEKAEKTTEYIINNRTKNVEKRLKIQKMKV